MSLDFNRFYQQLGFSAPPFQITPDTSFFFPDSQHMTALTHLRYGLLSGGFTVVTGEVGLGKTLLCRHVLKEKPADLHTAYLFNPPESYLDLLNSIAFDITAQTLKGQTLTQLNNEMYQLLIELAAQGKRAAVMVDEAHRLNADTLEALRLLSNLETEKAKLLSLILVGQTELDHTLALRAMRPLNQRISIRVKLKPFQMKESMQYIRHRLDVVRDRGDFSFTAWACIWAHRYAKGVPRRLNQICDRALIAAFAQGESKVSSRMVHSAAREVRGL